MASYSKFKNKLIKEKLQQKGLKKIVADSIEDGSLMDYVKCEMINSLGLNADGDEVIEAEFTEVE